MKTIPLVAAAVLLPFASYAQNASQQKHSFRLAVKEGDAFTDSGNQFLQMTLLRGDEILNKSKMESTKDERATVERVDDNGKVLQFLEETTREDVTIESEVQGQPMKQTQKGPLHGVSIRYTWKDDRYTKTLVTGQNNPRVTKKLADDDFFVLNENALPTKALAIGESEEIKDPKRLAEMLRAFGEDTEVKRPYTIMLKEIKKVDGVSLAVLEETVQIQAKFPVGPGVAAPIVLDMRMEVTFDIDKSYPNSANLEIQGTGELSQGGQTFKIELNGGAKHKSVKRENR